ncbi:mitochondrial 54S ribosomal protein YmL4 [Saccharomycopsis crataegensis]|uniref:Large ribosomal subunit protein uL29m n=1 Tax=Saccharomycopsis crataegensis TaxID=43959 RepID=A0AAV5QQ07_9ASCO|nr:mitochondrial 54S ribosomal protein YmL4 [Saccharomycopsis crataegensis]
MFKKNISNVKVAHFHTASKINGRIRSNIQIRAPIEPTVKNIKVNEDHPLWQFFHEKKFIRGEEDMQPSSWRSWTVPELRRKSFDDLHSLWFNCLKERNILAREAHLLESMKVNGGAGTTEQTDGPHDQLSEKVRTTMWRIRHVLGERQKAFENTQQVIPEYKQQFLENFKERYLDEANGATEVEQQDLEDQLARLNWALFGIDVNNLQDITINKEFVECVIYNGNLKLQKFGSKEQLDSVGVITNAYDAFPLFTLSQENSDKLGDLLASIEKNRSSEKYAEIMKMVPVKQLEQAILGFEEVL